MHKKSLYLSIKFKGGHMLCINGHIAGGMDYFNIKKWYENKELKKTWYTMLYQLSKMEKENSKLKRKSGLLQYFNTVYGCVPSISRLSIPEITQLIEEGYIPFQNYKNTIFCINQRMQKTKIDKKKIQNLEKLIRYRESQIMKNWKDRKYGEYFQKNLRMNINILRDLKKARKEKSRYNFKENRERLLELLKKHSVL
jgi:hypothetical protein